MNVLDARGLIKYRNQKVWASGGLIVKKNERDSYDYYLNIPNARGRNIKYDKYKIVRPDLICYYSGYLDCNGHELWSGDAVRLKGNIYNRAVVHYLGDQDIFVIEHQAKKSLPRFVPVEELIAMGIQYEKWGDNINQLDSKVNLYLNRFREIVYWPFGSIGNPK